MRARSSANHYPPGFLAAGGQKGFGAFNKAMQKYEDGNKQCSAAKRYAKLKLLKTRAPGDPPSALLKAVIGTAVADMGAEIWHQFTADARIVGTDGVCGCTAVAIVGTTGAIVAHITPDMKIAQEQFHRMKRLFDDNLKGKPLLRALMYYPDSVAGGTKKFQEA